jgi:hypothetical protein
MRNALAHYVDLRTGVPRGGNDRTYSRMRMIQREHLRHYLDCFYRSRAPPSVEKHRQESRTRNKPVLVTNQIIEIRFYMKVYVILYIFSIIPYHRITIPLREI